MRTYKEAIQAALDAAAHRNDYAYFYGAKGQRLTDATMNALWAAEPAYFAKYSPEQKVQIFNNSRGKIGHDCSGLTGWVCTGDKTYSAAQIEHCTHVTTDTGAATVAGSLLYKPGHIGIDIGWGYCVDIGLESTDAVVAAGQAGIRVRKITDCGWTKSGQCKLLDYTGADGR